MRLLRVSRTGWQGLTAIWRFQYYRSCRIFCYWFVSGLYSSYESIVDSLQRGGYLLFETPPHGELFQHRPNKHTIDVIICDQDSPYPTSKSTYYILLLIIALYSSTNICYGYTRSLPPYAGAFLPFRYGRGLGVGDYTASKDGAS